MTLENGPRHALIPIHLIDFDDHRFRFRKDFAHDNVIQLAEDIRENGQLNATKVRRKRDGRYQIIAGWRRAHAVKYLGDRPLRCDIYDGVTDEQAYRINIADNEQREDLTPLELAFQVSHLRDEAGYSVEKIADMHACKSSKIYDLLKLTQLPEELQDAVHSRSISLYLAFELGKVPVS
jgi:ParB family chromosome partitioning protein